MPKKRKLSKVILFLEVHTKYILYSLLNKSINWALFSIPCFAIPALKSPRSAMKLQERDHHRRSRSALFRVPLSSHECAVLTFPFTSSPAYLNPTTTSPASTVPSLAVTPPYKLCLRMKVSKLMRVSSGSTVRYSPPPSVFGVLER